MLPVRLSYDTDVDLRSPHGIVLVGARVNVETCSARIAARWPYTIMSDQIACGAAIPPLTHTIYDVARTSTAAQICENARKAFAYKVQRFDEQSFATVCRPRDPRATREAATRALAGPWRLAYPDGRDGYVFLEPSATVEAIDLFHPRGDAVFVTSAVGGDGLAAAVQQARQGADRSRPTSTARSSPSPDASSAQTTF